MQLCSLGLDRTHPAEEPVTRSALERFDMGSKQQEEEALDRAVMRVEKWLDNLHFNGEGFPKTKEALLKAVAPLCRMKYAADPSAVYEWLLERGFVSLCSICGGLAYSPRFLAPGDLNLAATLGPLAAVVAKLRRSLAKHPQRPSTPAALKRMLATYHVTTRVDPERLFSAMLSRGFIAECEEESREEEGSGQTRKLLFPGLPSEA